MSNKQLFSTTYETLKANRVLVGEAKGRWGADRYETTLPNGVVVVTTVEDEGYTQAIQVKGFLRVDQTMTDEPCFRQGDVNALLTVARMLGLDF
jgi:hypothetical protein